MSDEINIAFDCLSCVASPTVLEEPEESTDDSIVRCRHCGTEFRRFGDVKAKAFDEAKSHVEDIVRDAFKGVQGITFK